MLRQLIPLVLLLSLTASAPAQNSLRYPQNTVDGLLLLEGASSLLQGAQSQGVRPTGDGMAVELIDGVRDGFITLSSLPTDFPFNEAIPSWNGYAPENTGFLVRMRPSSARGDMEWLEAGRWGAIAETQTTRVVNLRYGKYDIDTLLLSLPVRNVDVRIDLVRADPGAPSPNVRLFALAYTNSLGDPALFQKFGRAGHGSAGRAAEVNIPYRSQVIPNKKWIGRICSPASITMALATYGIKVETQDVAASLYDSVADAFGVWNRSIQGGAQYGLRGYIRRYRNWDDVAQQLAQGSVICASIRFKAGEVVDPLAAHKLRKKGTEGHLVIVKGLTADGRAIVHDTASKDHGVSSIWSQEDLGKAWFDKGGVAYVITGPAGKSFTRTKPAAR
jgi:hypothetical protein